MNTPEHFKQRLADELNARATSLNSPFGHRALLRFAPRRRMAYAVGAVAAATAVAVALPLASGSPSSHQHGTAINRLDIVNADYAVKSQRGGRVSVELFNPKGAPGLEAALRRFNIPAVVRTPSASCHATIQDDRSERGDVTKVTRTYYNKRAGNLQLLITPRAIPRGDTLMFMVGLLPGQTHPIGLALVRQVPNCIGLPGKPPASGRAPATAGR